MQRLFVLTFAAALLVPSVSGALPNCPSFSCRRVYSCPERVICRTPDLARLDCAMAGLYLALQGAASRKGARELLESQRDWLADRDSCGCDVRCLYKAYQSRINAFRLVIDAAGE